MLIRIALFITLLASFYYYCEDGSSANLYQEMEDVKLNGIHENGIIPSINQELASEAYWIKDSTGYFVSSKETRSQNQGQLLSIFEQKP